LPRAILATNLCPITRGHHFYFALPHVLRAQSRLSMPPSLRVRQIGDGNLSTPETGDGAYTVDDPRLQDTFHVLRAAGPVRPAMPSRTIEIALDDAGSAPWYAVTTWTERDDSDFYCAEPWLGLPNAIGHGQGLRWLDAGAEERATCKVAGEALSRSPRTGRVRRLSKQMLEIEPAEQHGGIGLRARTEVDLSCLLPRIELAGQRVPRGLNRENFNQIHHFPSG
jgi:hypothetical protein